MVLKLREPSPSNNWTGAKCHMVDISKENDCFFSDDETDTEEAVDFCNGTWDGKQCVLRDKCLSFALINNEKYGVWGGCSDLTRKAIRKKYPSKGGRKNEQWRWMSEEEALAGLSREKLKKELEDELLKNTED